MKQLQQKTIFLKIFDKNLTELPGRNKYLKSLHTTATIDYSKVPPSSLLTATASITIFNISWEVAKFFRENRKNVICHVIYAVGESERIIFYGLLEDFNYSKSGAQPTLTLTINQYVKETRPIFIDNMDGKAAILKVLQENGIKIVSGANLLDTITAQTFHKYLQKGTPHEILSQILRQTDIYFYFLENNTKIVFTLANQIQLSIDQFNGLIEVPQISLNSKEIKVVFNDKINLGMQVNWAFMGASDTLTVNSIKSELASFGTMTSTLTEDIPLYQTL